MEEQLPQLLRSWTLPEEVVENFTNNDLTIHHLKELHDELLKELCPNISTRLQLRKKIQEYITAEASTSTANSSNPSCSQNDCESDIFGTNSEELNDIEILDLISARPPFPDFELKTLLSTSVCGNSILKYYDTHSTLTNKHRNHLTDIIIRHIFTRLINHRITYEEYNILTAKIISLFPKENTGTYFVPPIKKRYSIDGKPGFARGKLVDKVRNTLYKSGERKRKKPETETDENTVSKTCKNIDSIKDLHNDDIIWLKNNTEPWNQVIEKWSNTYDARDASLNNTLQAFIEEWPILNDLRGDILINIDFEKKYPQKGTKFFQNWTLFLEKLKNLRNPSQKEDTATLVEFIDSQPNEDKKLTAEIKLLCMLVPPRGRFNKRQKFSTLECIESFIVQVEKPGDIELRIETICLRAAKNKRTVQPYVIHCTTEAEGIYYLVLDKVRYIFKTAYKAFDTLFKCYHTFHATYPPAADHLYVLIQRCVYGIETKYDKIVPYISDLIVNAKV